MTPRPPRSQSRRTAIASNLALSAANLSAAAVVVWLAPTPDVLVLCLVVLLGFAGTWLRDALTSAPPAPEPDDRADLSEPAAPGAPTPAARPAGADGRDDAADRSARRSSSR